MVGYIWINSAAIPTHFKKELEEGEKSSMLNLGLMFFNVIENDQSCLFISYVRLSVLLEMPSRFIFFLPYLFSYEEEATINSILQKEKLLKIPRNSVLSSPLPFKGLICKSRKIN